MESPRPRRRSRTGSGTVMNSAGTPHDGPVVPFERSWPHVLPMDPEGGPPLPSRATGPGPIRGENVLDAPSRPPYSFPAKRNLGFTRLGGHRPVGPVRGADA